MGSPGYPRPALPRRSQLVRGDRYAEALCDLSVVRVAVNQNYVGLEHPVREGDEIAVFPPVTGG